MTIADDVGYAARLMWRRPALSVTAVLTLMLGTGSTTAVFSLVDALHVRSPRSRSHSLLAVLIAAVGLYGVLAYSVARRRREIGVRVAVGARPAVIEQIFLCESLVLVAARAVLGIPVAVAVTRPASSLLFELSPHDPISIGMTLRALVITAATAAYLPARAAARIDRIHALRQE